MTSRQQKALAALLTAPNKLEAAKAAGISDRTLRDYLADPEFQAAYRKAFAELVQQAAREAQRTISPAICTLRELMQDDAQNGQIRVSAARSVLEYSLKLTEQADILDRLAELEAAIGGEEHER